MQEGYCRSNDGLDLTIVMIIAKHSTAPPLPDVTCLPFTAHCPLPIANAILNHHTSYRVESEKVEEPNGSVSLLFVL
jgi:hypothetical protein